MNTQSLQKQSRYIEAFFQHSLTPLVILDREFNFIRVNEAYAKAGQREVDDFPGHNHFEFYPSDAKAIFEEVVRTKQPFQISARPFVYSDHPEWGVTYWDWTLTPLLDDEGEVEVLVFALEDVTKQKRVEIELKKHREHLEELVRERTRELEEATARLQTEINERKQTESKLNYLASFPKQNPNPVMEMDLSGSIRYINSAALKLFPDICEQGLDHPWFADWAAVVAYFQAGPNDTRVRDVMVGERYYQQSFYYSASECFVRIYGFDITDRKQMEGKLQKSEEKYRNIVETANEGIWEIDDQTCTTYVNQKMADLLGYTVEEMIGTSSYDYIDQADKTLADSRLASRKVEKHGQTEFKFRRKDGSFIWVISKSTTIFDVDGSFAGAFAMFTDITDRKRAEVAIEAARQESEERYQDLFKRSPGAIILHDGVRILEVNPAVGVMLKFENPDDLIGTKVLDIVAPEYRELASSRIQLILDQEVSTSSKEICLVRRDGSPVYVESVSGICRYHGRKIVQVILHNITKRKELERELQETNSRLHELTKEMMTTLEEERRMISRELHDEAGQALTALKMYIELILKGVPTDAVELRQRIGEAVKLTDQTLKDIRRLAQDLRPPGLDALGLNLTLEDFCYEFGKRVGLDIKYQGCKLPVLSGIARISLFRFLQEALTNVVKHAKADTVYVRLGYQCQQISLAVNDNGLGFELNNVELKRESLGLVGMRERLSILGGTLTIDSKPGQGTSMLATIPWEVADDPDLNR
jgi:PAS domain S-box-containing protein